MVMCCKSCVLQRVPPYISSTVCVSVSVCVCVSVMV